MNDIIYEEQLEICYNCKFYHKIENTEAGSCKFNAPISTPSVIFIDRQPNISNHLAQWPVIFASDHCGQFKSKIEKIPQKTFIDVFLEYIRK